MNEGAGSEFEEVTLDDLGRIRRYVRETAVGLGCDAESADELVIAVNEAVANIVRHGYGETPGPVKVAVTGNSKMVEVILLDFAPAFDPTLVPSPDTTLPLVERPFGGMGVHLMREFCDELTYRRMPEGQNEFKLVKLITAD